MNRASRVASDSGQAAVEAVLTLPLVVFLVLGALQMFMVLQARIMAQYAVYKAVRTGSTMHGDCAAMTHTAIANLLPTLARTDGTVSLTNAFIKYQRNRYNDGTPLHTGQIVELYRESPRVGTILPAIQEDNAFDQPGKLERLDLRMLYWYRLRIPFADWVLSKMFLAQYGLRTYDHVDPLMVVQTAHWGGGAPPGLLAEPWPGGPPGDNMVSWANGGAYLVPIRVTASMRMMTPPEQSFFPKQECAL